MAGLIQQQMPAPQAAQQQAGSDLDSSAMRVLIAGKKALTQPEIANQVVNQMKSAPDPASGIAMAALYLMKALIEKSKGSIPKAAIAPALLKILVDIARVGQSKGLFRISPDLLVKAAQVARQMIADKLKQLQAQPAATQQPMGA